MARTFRSFARLLTLVVASSPAIVSAQYSAAKIGEYLHYATAAANGGIYCGYDSIDYSSPSLYTPAQGWVDLPEAAGVNTSYQYYGSTTGISHDGSVISGYTVGEVSNGVYVQYAAYWVNGVENLVPDPPDDPTANNMTATSVSGDGSTLLIEDTTSAHIESYAYNIKSGTFTPLGYFGSTVKQTYVTAASLDGSIVAGYSNRDDNTTHGFIWTAATGMTDIGIPPGYPNTFYVEPKCMSDDGSVVYGSYTYGGGWEGFRYTSSGFQDLNGIVPSECTADGSEVVGTENLYFPGLWSATMGGGYVDHLLSANGVASTVGDYVAPFCLAPNGRTMAASTIFGYSADRVFYGTAQIGLPFPLTTAPIADGGYYTTPYATMLSVTAPGVTGLAEFGGGSTATLVKGPLHASKFALHPDGSFYYTPKYGYGDQTDTFTYKLTNAYGQSAAGTVQIAVASRITSVSPSTILVGSRDTTVTLTGAGFVSGDYVLLDNYTTLATNYISPTQLQVVIPASDLSYASTLALNVDGLSNSVNVTVGYGPYLSKMVIPGSIYENHTYTCQITLTSPAGAKGATVKLFSSNATAASVPATVTFAAGQSTANFTLTSHAVTRNTNETISAFLGKSALRTTITVQP